MKIFKIDISNYRLLKDFNINLQDELSLVIGKNNTGKTSFLSILEKFLLGSKQNFSFSDINIEAQNSFKEKFENENFNQDYFLGVTLKLYIEYNEDDDLSNISEVMLNLKPDENVVVIQFAYSLEYENIKRLKKDFQSDQSTNKDDIISYLEENHSNYFQIREKALEYNNEANSVPVEKSSTIERIINFKRINAKRDVVNPDGSSTSSADTLSRKSSRYYEKISGPEIENESIQDLKAHMQDVDTDLDKVYSHLFGDLISKVKRFGGVQKNDSKIEIKSQLEGKNLLKDNTSVMYSQDGHSLPEDYNGLGYLNLISMIFEIEVVLNDFKQKTTDLKKPSDINLFFIEEPEAHTHPQMQYIFIKNIKELLQEESKGKEDGVPIDLQTIISTHSSHITAESDFNDIKYFVREDTNKVTSKDLKQLKAQYEQDSKRYKFLKKYLTLSRAELFFADKVILIEGDTERILIPSIMQKIDNEEESESLALASQNISTIEVGAYSHIFDKLINFLNIKALLVTDIDSEDQEGKAPVQDAYKTGNSSIKHFLNTEDIDSLTDLDLEQKCLTKNGEEEWESDTEGNLLVVYQESENNYHPRSFEDSFININRDFINENKDTFQGLKHKAYFENPEKNPFELAADCIEKKTDFALDIIYHSDENYSNWEIPSYLKKGLLWLKK